MIKAIVLTRDALLEVGSFVVGALAPPAADQPGPRPARMGRPARRGRTRLKRPGPIAA
jgi:hypothetical protein